MKRLQNRIAYADMTLPVVAAFTIVVWLFSGLATRHLWPQLACFAASVYLLIELSNQNALLRVRSRMVSCTFMSLSCTASFLFPSISGNTFLLCMVAALLLLLSTYQDSQAVGRTFYAFVFVSLASVAFVQVLLFVPVLWILMATYLQSLGFRSWMASVLGLLTPYWFAMLWLIYLHDFTPLADHFALLASGLQPQSVALTLPQITSYVFTLVLTVAGLVHVWHRSYEDKIRTRQLYGFFSLMSVLSLLLVALLPHLFDPLMRLALVCVSPLIAHFLTLTSTRWTNMAFIAAIIATVALTYLSVTQAS